MPRFRRSPTLDKPVSLKVTAEEDKALRDESRKRGIAVADVIRDALDIYYLARESMPDGADLYESVKTLLSKKAGKQ